MTHRVRVVMAAAIAIEAARVCIALPYAVHHGCITACYRR
jgi:hypothetical protein